MFDISLDGVKKYMDTTLVLKNITFMVNGGEKAGIIGENGSGKTTILKLIAGKLKLNHCAGYPYAPVPPGYDEGFVVKPETCVCAYLDQMPEYREGIKVIEVLNLAFEEVQEIEKEMRKLEEDMKVLTAGELDAALNKYSKLSELYEIKGGYETTEKINRICKGLKFGESFLGQEFNQLSGGEKTTVVLGKLLIDNPDILLLDEPTNHLDMESVEWLEDYLKNYKGTVIIVSHDRYFLDNVVTKIIEIEDKISTTYKGNYSQYVLLKEDILRIQNDNYREQQKKIDSMEKSVKELRDWALRADNNKFFKRAASMQIKLDKMERIEKPVLEKRNMKLNFSTIERSGNVTIQAENLSKSFGNKILLKDAGLLVSYGERVALIGSNGSGKTTFLKMLFGEETPGSGYVKLGANVRTAYLPQKISFGNEELTVLDCFREDILILEGKAREYLAKFMFYGGNVYKKIKHLSGGEKIRLKLSKLLYEDINLLILDEPTNHLDTVSIETLEKALEGFKGTIFFISHDRYFINKIGERIIAIEEKTFKSYLGNYDYYREILDGLSKRKEDFISEGNRKAKEGLLKKEEKSRNEQKISNGKKRGENVVKDKKKKSTKDCHSKEKGRVELETKIETIEQKIKDTITLMADRDIELEELNKLYQRDQELNRELDGLMSEWVKDNT